MYFWAVCWSMNSCLFLSSFFSSSTDINIRTKRSKPFVNQSRRPGCSLGTCTVHDLAHRLHQLNNKMKIGSAPIDKISPQGYGRRRRSLPVHGVTLRLEQGRLRPVWSNTDSQVHKLEALLRRTWAGLCEERQERKREGATWSERPLCSVLKFSKCLRLLPSNLQHIFFQAWGLSKTGCTEMFWLAEASSPAMDAAGLRTLDWHSWSNYRCWPLLGGGKEECEYLATWRQPLAERGELSSNILGLLHTSSSRPGLQVLSSKDCIAIFHQTDSTRLHFSTWT